MCSQRLRYTLAAKVYLSTQNMFKKRAKLRLSAFFKHYFSLVFECSNVNNVKFLTIFKK